MTCTSPGASEEEIACVTSSGMWVSNSCGDYDCGLAPICDAVVPGCNCGPYRNFTGTECVVDDSCDTASLPFTCGESTCSSVGEQYCEEHTFVDTPPNYACRDIPDSCFATALECSCAHLVDAIGNAETCYGGRDGQFVVELKPEP